MTSSTKKWIIRAPQDNVKEQTFYNRHRKDVITLFDLYAEVNGKLDEPAITYSYPSDFNEEAIFNSIRKFTFPCGKYVEEENLEASAVQLFTFVLTEGTGNFTYGYCRFAPSTGICACIISGYYFTSLFYKLLNHLAMAKTTDKIEAILSNGYHLYVPGPGERLELNELVDPLKFSCQIPDPGKLPTLNDDKILMEFFNGIEDGQMIALFTALLFERRIIITGKKLGQLTACCFALTKVIYPFHWQYTFIPLLPQHLLDMLALPMPFIIGLPKELFQRVQNKSTWGDFVLFDLDTKVFESPYFDQVPHEVRVYLKTNLKQSSNTFLSDNFMRTFVRANALMFGKYKSGFSIDPETKEQVYDLEKLIKESRASIVPFLRQVMIDNGASYFDGFVTERLRPTSKREIHDEEFENEILLIEKKGYSLAPTAPETLQNAMINVKDGASDVLESLKGKMQAISIKEKIGRFTPKSHRRRKTKLKNLDPLSVDASQYKVASLDHVDSAIENGASHNEEEDYEEDLIDFSDPQSQEGHQNLDGFNQPRTSLHNDAGFDFSSREAGSMLSDSNFMSLYPVFDSFPPSSSSSIQSTSRQLNGDHSTELSRFPDLSEFSTNGFTNKTFSNWEKFE